MKNSYFIFALCAATLLTSTAMALTQFEVDCSKLDPSDPKYCPDTLAPDPSLPGTIGGSIGEEEVGNEATDDDEDEKNPIKDALIDVEFPGGNSGTTTETPTIVDDANKYVPSTNLNCHSISCADLGYTQTSVANCETYVRCPFDVSYQICAKYADNYNLTSCPAGANCTAKYKVTSCKTGYRRLVNLDTGEISCSATLADDSTCSASLTSCPTGWECTSCTKSGTTYYAKTGNCATGYEKGPTGTATVTSTGSTSLKGTSSLASGLNTNTLGSLGSNVELGSETALALKDCYKSACKLDIVSELSDKYVKLDNGGFYVYDCQDGYNKGTSIDGCTVCLKSATILPETPSEGCYEGATCPTGAICSLNRLTGVYNISSCQTGYLAVNGGLHGSADCIARCTKS